MDTEQRFVMSMLVAVDAVKGNKVEQGAEESKKMPLEIGHFYDIRITGADEYDLTGEPVR